MVENKLLTREKIKAPRRILLLARGYGNNNRLSLIRKERCNAFIYKLSQLIKLLPFKQFISTTMN